MLKNKGLGIAKKVGDKTKDKAGDAVVALVILGMLTTNLHKLPGMVMRAK